MGAYDLMANISVKFSHTEINLKALIARIQQGLRRMSF
jgi:hypothetical protein